MVEISGVGSSRRYYSPRQIAELKKKLLKSYKYIKKVQQAEEKYKSKEEQEAEELIKQVERSR